MNTELASRGSRLGSALIDTLIFLPPGIIVGYGYEESTPTLLIGVLAILGLMVVQIVFLTTAGQSIGKKAVHIRIVKVDTGGNGGFVPNVLLRGIVNGLIGSITSGVYGLIDTLFIFREDRRCIHDFIAGTRVVKA